jgi:hypothetical protein
MTAAMEWDTPEVLGPRSRRLIVKRLGYPAGTVEVCERVEGAFGQPVTVSWLPTCDTPGFEGPAGFYATHPGGPFTAGWRLLAAYGATESELIVALKDGLPPGRWGAW